MNINIKKKLTKLISFIPILLITILILWYKAPINGIKYYPESVLKIDINYNGKAIVITNTNDINFIIKSLNSISLNKSMPKINKSKIGYSINIHSTNKNTFNDFVIYSSEAASIGNFYYTDKNIMLPYEYIKNLYSNVN